MFNWLKTRWSRRERVRCAPVHDAPADAADHFATLRTARQLCEAIDRGAELKLWDHVGRLAESAGKLSWFDAPLAQRLAKIRIAQGEPETALAMLDRDVNTPASSRLLRIMCLLSTGARTEAQLALLDWSRNGSAHDMPAEGRLLLALLDWHNGDVEMAARALRDTINQSAGESARWTQMMLVLLAASQGHWDRATHSAGALVDSDDGLAVREITIMLDSLRLRRPVDAEHQRQERIEQMASELPTASHLIEPLVEAQKRHFEQPVAEELLAVLEQAYDEMGAHQATAAEAIGRLHALLGENDAAMTWARRGLALNPMSARLVLLLNELEAVENASTSQERAA